MTQSSAEPKITLTVTFDMDSWNDLQVLKKELDLSGNQIVRSAVRRLGDMHLRNVPTCATGQACACPHLLVRTPQTRTPRA